MKDGYQSYPDPQCVLPPTLDLTNIGLESWPDQPGSPKGKGWMHNLQM